MISVFTHRQHMKLNIFPFILLFPFSIHCFGWTNMGENNVKKTAFHCYNYLLRPSESPPLIDESNLLSNKHHMGKWNEYPHWNWCGARHTCSLVDWKKYIWTSTKIKKNSTLNIPAKITIFFDCCCRCCCSLKQRNQKNGDAKRREREKRINLKIVSRNVGPNTYTRLPNRFEWRITDI